MKLFSKVTARHLRGSPLLWPEYRVSPLRGREIQCPSISAGWDGATEKEIARNLRVCLWAQQGGSQAGLPHESFESKGNSQALWDFMLWVAWSLRPHSTDWQQKEKLCPLPDFFLPADSAYWHRWPRECLGIWLITSLLFLLLLERRWERGL